MHRDGVNKAEGSINFFGDSLAHVGGARGPACTVLPQAKFSADFITLWGGFMKVPKTQAFRPSSPPA
jgi:hypothetical protein